MARFRQILLNLLTNAVKFTSEGEIVVDVSLAEPGEEHNLVRVAVADTGIGIPADRQDRLFKSFSQVDASTTRRFGGTGLGLAIAKSLAELMGGEIGVHCDRPRGTEFWYTTRFGACHPSKIRPKVIAPAPTRVLIVDDNATNREILVEALGNWRMRPHAVDCGPAAIDALRAAAAEDPFQVALIDMQMPDMDGLQLADAIQTDQQIKGVRVIMISSISGTADATDLDNHGIEAYLPKPVRLSSLFELLAGHTRRETRYKGPVQETAADALRGPRLLVAEDNRVNQIVISELLKRFGVNFDIVDDGRQAVQAWLEDGPFDAVLMDCEMPYLDGLGATAEIRAAESADPALGRTPIIALTANAIQGDRERCIAGGMDDYLSKPLDQAAVIRTIARHTKPDQQAEQPQPAPIASSTEATPEATPEATQILAAPATAPLSIDLDSTLERFGGNPETVRLVLDVFAEDAAKTMRSLSDAIERGDHEAARADAHKLKGSAGNAGAARLAQLASDLQQASVYDRPADLVERCEEMLNELDRVLVDIRSLDLSNAGPGAAA